MINSAVLAFLSAVLYGASFPPFNLSFLSWFSLVPLLLSIEQSDSWIKKFYRGWICGIFSNLIIFYWIVPTFLAAKVGIPLAVGCWLALSTLLGLYFGIFTLLYFKLPQNHFRFFLGAALWVMLEFVRSHVLTGFPWTLLAHTQAYHPLVIQIVRLSGASLVSFLIILINLSLSELIKNKKISLGVCLNFTFLILVLTYGIFRLYLYPHSIERESFRVAILQGNIDQYQKWDEAYEEKIRRTYSDLATRATSQKIKPNLIIWPESAIPGWFPNEPKEADWIKNLAIKTQTHHIIGAVSRNGELDHNAAFLIGPQGNILGQYNKQHLVPFGEYVPFGKFFGKWIPYIGQLGTFDKGSDPVAFNVFDVKMAPNICYEAVFPGLIRNTLDKDVRCIINITNDAWYLNTGAPEQHFATNIFRAIENNRPVIRAANTGISAIINEDGEVVGRTKLMTEDVLFGEVYFEEFPWEFPEETLFSKWGDWFSWFCTFVFVLSFSFVLISQRRKTI